MEHEHFSLFGGLLEEPVEGVLTSLGAPESVGHFAAHALSDFLEIAVLLFVVMLLIFIFGVVAIALLGAGFWALTAYPPTGIAVLGGALICLGLAMLCVLLFMWAGSALKSLMNAYRSRRQHR